MGARASSARASAFLLLLWLCACAAPSPACAPVASGTPGAQAQLRYVDASDDRIAFTFGLSAVPGGFDVPEHAIAFDASALDITFRGASALNPDGLPSYFGPRSFDLEQGGRLRELALVEDRERTLRWRATLDRARCPRVAAKTYTIGTFPRAQVVLLLGDAASLMLEPDARPAREPVTISGVGFTPSSAVRVTIGEVVAETTADAKGNFQVGTYVPALATGRYRAIATDANGRVGIAWFTVTR